MGVLRLNLYRELHERRWLRLVWMVLNVTMFSFLPRIAKVFVLRRFGATAKNWSLYRRGVRIFAPWNLEIGNALLGPRVKLYNKGKIRIGDSVIISQDAYLCTATHDHTSPTFDLITKPIVIEDNVWIAARAVVLPGVTIGEGAVVGACAVVAKDVPPWTVVVGNPAKVVSVRSISDDAR